MDVRERLGKLGDSELIGEAVGMREKEKRSLYALLLLFGEIDERKLYRDEGYPSFFAYLESGLGYSKASAYRRVEGARFLRKKPELYGKLTSGELSFSSLVELSKCQDRANLGELVEKSSGKSKDEVAALVALETAPVTPKKRDSIRVVKTKAPEPTPLAPTNSDETPEPVSAAEPDSQVSVQLAFEVDQEFMSLYQEAKAIAGGRSMKEVFKKVLSDYTKRKSPKNKIERRKPRIPRQGSGQDRKVSSTPSVASTSRHIPEATKDEVRVRDASRCTYISPSGKRCQCREHLQFDHIIPFSVGGPSTTKNLRLLCPAHNQLLAEQILGREFMELKRAQRTRCST